MSHSIDRSSTPSAARLSLTLLLSCLLVFPDGAALAQTACNKTNWYTSTSANQNLPYNIETFAAVINVAQNGHPYLYAIGGNDYYPAGSDDYQTTVAYFELGSNGSVGNSTTQSLWNLDGQPVGLARDLCGVVYTNNAGTISYLYTVGGATEDMKTGTFNLTNQIWFAQIKANGSLGTWTKADVLMPSALQLHGTAILNGYLYVIGGTTTKGDTGLSAGLTSEVVIFQINDSNGNLETTYNGGQGYQTGPAIYSGASAGDGIYKTCPVVDAAKNTIYVAGGENKVGDPYVSTVMYATQDQNGTGTLSSWASANDLGTTSSGGGTATPLAAQAVVYNDYDNYNAIILMGGDTGSSGSGAQDKDTSNVLQGVIADWPAGINWSWSPTPLPSLPVGIPPGSGVIERNAGATYKNFIYSLGGEVTDNGSSDINAIYCLELN